jgi:hypothetical protein
MLNLKIIFISLAILQTFNSFCWGPTGHRVVGGIAEQHLSKSTLKKVKKILDGHGLARVSTWPDEIKSKPAKYSHTFNWHWTDWPEGQKKYNFKKNSGTLIQSINDQLKTLKNKKAKKEKKAWALKFLTHLIGDLHQPLHVGTGLDRGGNLCEVTFHKQRINLHRLWDERLIEFSKLSYSELVKFINIPKIMEKESYQTGSILSWARESKELRSTLYPKESKNAPKSKSSLPSYCQRELKLKDDQLPKLSYAYSYRFLPIIEKRLYQAGVRLAYLIEKSL